MVGPADVHGAAQGAGVGDDRPGVLPRHARAGEGGGDRGHGRDHLDLQAVFGCAEVAYDSEEAGIPVGEDHGAAPVAA